jgi:hypothetical protein
MFPKKIITRNDLGTEWDHYLPQHATEDKATWQTLVQNFPHNETHRYKWCEGCIIEMRHPTTEEFDRFQCNEKRQVKDTRFAKYRANAMYVIRIWNVKQKKWVSQCINPLQWQHHVVVYNVNTVVEPHDYWLEESVVCAAGIHYFKTLFPAFLYSSKWSFFDDQGSGCIPEIASFFEVSI